jgi:hypothetical protein
MTENVNNVSGVVGRVSGGIARMLCGALLCMVKTSGKSVGYAGRITGGVCNAAKQLVGYGSPKRRCRPNWP